MLLAQMLQALDQREVEVFKDVNVCLPERRKFWDRIYTSAAGFTLIMQTYGPTPSMIDKRSSAFVTSTLTARLDFFRSTVSRIALAVEFEKFCTLAPYD